MPIYEYECGSCGQVTEVMQKISDPGPDHCAACSKGPMVKIMSRTGFILKGSGWYVTDFKDSKKKPQATTPPSQDSQTSTPAETKGSDNSSPPPAKETKSEGSSTPSSSPLPSAAK